MRALTYQGKRDFRVETVPDPRIQDPTDIIVKITSTGICGSDLHLYEVLGPYLDPGDILGHERMGVVEEIGPEVTAVAPGDRVVIPFNVSCGHCHMCSRDCTPSARRPRSASTARAPHSSDTPSCTGRCPADRPSTCGCPSGTNCPSRSRTAPRTTGSSTSPTCCPPPGRPWSTRLSRPEAASPSSASAPSGRWPHASPSTEAPAW